MPTEIKLTFPDLSKISVLPWVVFAVVPVCALYFGIQLYYRRSGPDLQRLDAMSRSPIQASLAEGNARQWYKLVPE